MTWNSAFHRPGAEAGDLDAGADPTFTVIIPNQIVGDPELNVSPTLPQPVGHRPE